MGKSTISTRPFSIAMCMFTRGYLDILEGQPGQPSRNTPKQVGSTHEMGTLHFYPLLIVDVPMKNGDLP